MVERLRFRLRVHRRVAEERERAAPNVVGAALGYHVQHAGAAAVLRVEALGQDAELLDSLERIELREAADGVVVVVSPVNHVVDVAAIAAADLRRILRGLASDRSGNRCRPRALWQPGSRTDGR